MILGASFDGIEANRRFAEKYNFPFSLLCDTDRSLGLAYGAADDAGAATPRRTGVVIDPAGRIARYWPKVSPRDFPLEALAAIP